MTTQIRGLLKQASTILVEIDSIVVTLDEYNQQNLLYQQRLADYEKNPKEGTP